MQVTARIKRMMGALKRQRKPDGETLRSDVIRIGTTGFMTTKIQA